MLIDEEDTSDAEFMNTIENDSIEGEDEAMEPDTPSNSDFGCVATNDNYFIIYPTLAGGCI